MTNKQARREGAESLVNMNTIFMKLYQHGELIHDSRYSWHVL